MPTPNRHPRKSHPHPPTISHRLFHWIHLRMCPLTLNRISSRICSLLLTFCSSECPWECSAQEEETMNPMLFYINTYITIVHSLSFWELCH